MPIASPGVTLWFRDANGRVSQINNVIQVTVGTPLLGNGYYRDSPPSVVGGASAAEVGGTEALVVAGGTQPVIDDGGGTVFSIISPASVLQDDNYTHEVLRYIFSPVPIVFFTTTSGLATAPTDSTFSTDRPAVPTKASPSSGGHFDVFDVDCFFWLSEDCGCFNSPPPGFAPGSSS